VVKILEAFVELCEERKYAGDNSGREERVFEQWHA
jgi:hypothetical protein